MSSAPQRQLIRALADEGVEFVLIGGFAVAAHGYIRATRDVDIVFSTEPSSCERLAGVLRKLGAVIELADLPEPTGGITGEWLQSGGHFRFATDAGPLDALSTARGLDYETLVGRAVTIDLDGWSVPVCSYEDLVLMKRSTGRPRDLEDLRELEDERTRD